ncbi:hypothetical protein TNCT_69231 [Trichonephila clavata]|uniref:Uncharacterized protein n=1 Tax=Trichonephila clavata TaxID=2740835 RepID=A0A8X6FDZ2_TRICU|nr:hypothetical protein TNCT_69231 [Trichonephila clavata]
MTLRLQNITANDSLIATQRSLYSTQDELNAVKLENMKLRQKVKELTVKPDEEIPKKREPKVEYLPWYKPNPKNTTASEETSSVKTTSSTNKRTVTIDLGKVDEAFQEVKQLKSNKTALKESNSVATNDQSSKTSFSDNIEKENEKYNFTPIKLKYKPLVKSKNDNCAQQ